MSPEQTQYRKPRGLVPYTEYQHIAVPLVMQFISGATTSSIFTVRPPPISYPVHTFGREASNWTQLCGTLLTGLNPNASATVQASYNLVRCIGAGAAIASQQPLANAAGLGWCFGVFALIMLSTAPLAMVLKRRGPSWRK